MIGHFLQSREWKKFEELEGRETFWIEGDGFWALAVKEVTPLGAYLYCPYGPVLGGDESADVSCEGGDDVNDCRKRNGLAFERALRSLRELAKEQKAFFVRVEPRLVDDVEKDGGSWEKCGLSVEEMEKMGLKKSRDLNPAHTWVLDLTASWGEIFGGIEKNKARVWRNYAKKGMEIKVTQDPEAVTVLTSLLAQVGRRNHFSPQNELHLKNQLKSGFATLYVVELEGEPIAATLVHDFDGVRYYMHAAADEKRRRLEAGSVALIQAIADAQEAGMRLFDFWGITTSEDPGHPWYGFTRYKKSFGGRQVGYAGTWDLPVQKVRYFVYGGMRKLNRLGRSLRKR